MNKVEMAKLDSMIRAVSKAHQQAKKLQESLTNKCGKLEKESLQRRESEPRVLFAAPVAPSCESRVREEPVPYGPQAEAPPVRQRVWWNPLTWKN